MTYSTSHLPLPKGAEAFKIIARSVEWLLKKSPADLCKASPTSFLVISLLYIQVCSEKPWSWHTRWPRPMKRSPVSKFSVRMQCCTNICVELCSNMSPKFEEVSSPQKELELLSGISNTSWREEKINFRFEHTCPPSFIHDIWCGFEHACQTYLFS